MTRQTTDSSPLSIGFVSLGCAKNLVDSQLMAGVLVSEGLRLAPRPEEADVVVVNTCAFIEDARAESLGFIREACRLKKAGRCRAVIVTGCLPQRYREDLPAEWPEVDAFLGLDELERIGDIARRVAAGERPIVEIPRQATRLFEPKIPGLVFAGGPHAYLKIAEGCDHRCSFCAIPGIRGRYRSRPSARILREAEVLLQNGFRELDLISQDTTRYGRDLKQEPGMDLAALLRALGRLDGTYWIRLLYGYPSGITDGLLAAMAETPRVCPYFDIPIQHSDPDILRAMGRADTVAPLGSLAARIRRALPDAALRTTCLVGFPGETEARFRRLMDFVQETEFDHLGVFVYSPEEGTRATALPGRPDRQEAEERRARLLELQQEIVGRKAAAWIGREAEVLLETPDGPAAWIARSARQAPDVDGRTLVDHVPADAKPGDFVRVRHTAADGYDLRAVCSHPIRSS